MAEAKGKDKPDLTAITPEGTACFPAMFEPREDPNGKVAYGLVLVFDEGTELKELRTLAARALVHRFKDADVRAAAKAWLANTGADNTIKVGKVKYKMPFRDAEEYDQYGEPFEANRVFINTKTSSRPGLVNARAKPIINEEEFYAGCRARASVYAWAYDTNGNRGVTFLLNNVQKLRDGPRLGGRQRAEDEFDAVDTGDDSDAEDLL